MASLLKPLIALILLNLIFLTSAASSSTPKKSSPTCNKPSKCPKPSPPKPRPSPPKQHPSPPKHHPSPKTRPFPSPARVKCPRNVLKFFICGNWLRMAILDLGTPPSHKCCTLMKGMIDFEAAVCLCTAIKGRVMGVFDINIPMAISMVVGSCQKDVPQGFQCS